MSRIAALARFQLKELVRSFAIAAPMTITLALYWLFFEFPGDVDYFAATGGFVLLVASLVTTLLLAGQANRMSSTAVVVRLPRRSELLGAIVASALVVAVAMAVLFTGLALGQAKVAMTVAHLAVIAPRWLLLAALFAVVGLHLSRLVSRGGSHLIALGVLALLATVVEQEGVLLRGNLAGLARAVLAVSDPIMAALRAPALPTSLAGYASNLLLMAAYAVGLFILAAWLFRRKDLLWVD
ncbi:MAG TPA: hypothetical protein VL334_04110 [Anaerolineae bacterium]|nr:hypothetical protein [Anaerolineae bacterium]